MRVMPMLACWAGALLVAAPSARAQSASAADTAVHSADSGRPAHFWRDMSAGFLSSILVHEAAHVATSLALGKTPSFGFDKGRPTIYSGIQLSREPHKQFLFSSMGLNAQAALDEVILDAPHRRGAPFERGVLAGGIATALFYITIGRNASVSDVELMARTSTLNKTQITLIYGGIAALHAVRIHRDSQYADFFVRPVADGGHGLKVGISLPGAP